MRIIGGLLLAIGGVWILGGMYYIAETLGEEDASARTMLLDTLLLMVPGLIAMGIGAKIGRRRSRGSP